MVLVHTQKAQPTSTKQASDSIAVLITNRAFEQHSYDSKSLSHRLGWSYSFPWRSQNDRQRVKKKKGEEYFYPHFTDKELKQIKLASRKIHHQYRSPKCQSSALNIKPSFSLWGP